MDFHPDKNKTDGNADQFDAPDINADQFDAPDINAYQFDASDINDADEQEFTAQENKEKDVFEETNSHDKTGNDYSQSSSEPTPDKSEESDDEDTDEAGDEEFDLDDETLYKVLKFLADNDYVITKRTRKTPVNRGQTFRDENGKFSGYGGYRSYEYRGHLGATRGPSGAPRSHQGHDHPWTASHQHKPRSGERPAHYSAQFHGFEQVYCKVSTSWEGQVKVTTRTCY